MIRVCKTPSIKEYEDRWGQPTGQFYVEDIQGDISLQMWEDIRLYESYYETQEGKQEMDEANKMLAAGSTVSQIDMPLMKKLLDKAGGHMMWQFNMRTKILDDDTADYVRSYALFGEKTLSAWSPSHNERVKKLQEEVDRMNSKP